MGVNLDLLDSPQQQTSMRRSDVGPEAASLSDREDFFTTDDVFGADDDDDVGDYIYVDDDVSEELPSALPLVRDSDYIRASGPNPPEWFQRGREGHNRHGNVDKFFTIGGSGNPFWPFGFGSGRKPRPPPRDNGQKKILVGDSGLCGTGKCEFVLACMLAGGKFTGGCGGFLYGCCERPGTLQSFQVAQKVRALFHKLATTSAWLFLRILSISFGDTLHSIFTVSYLSIY